MTHQAQYSDGIKQWQPFSEYHQQDPYVTFRYKFGHLLYAVDIDQREIRVIDGVPQTVAFIERKCCPGRIYDAMKYISRIWEDASARMNLDSLAHDAHKLGIPAYLLCHTSDMQQFVVARLPWDGKTFRNWNASQYRQFIEDLGKKGKAA